MPKIIGLVGPMASGKGTVAKYLAEKYHGRVFGFSTPLRDILTRLHMDHTRENMANLSTILRQQFGQDLISRVIVADITEAKEEFLILDGIRRLSDIDAAKTMPGFVLWAVQADSQTRYQRLVRRQQNAGDQQKTYEQFLNDEQSEADKTIAAVAAQSRIIIDNNGDLEKLYKKIDELMTN